MAQLQNKYQSIMCCYESVSICVGECDEMLKVQHLFQLKPPSSIEVAIVWFLYIVRMKYYACTGQTMEHKNASC